LNEITETEYSDTLESDIEVKSSSRVLAAVRKSQDTFRDYQDTCARVDDIYNKDIASDGNWSDNDFDLFWGSMEIIKPAIYARAPQPAVAPMFADNTPLKNTTAELLERVTAASFERTGIDQVMLGVRDDLAFTNRGVIWVTYETEDGQKACIEHLDRTDFGHEPARQWEDVGYVWRRAWMTKSEMRKRFRKTSGDAYQKATFAVRREDKNNGAADDSKKAGVYEVWHKADNRVYWVAEGVPVMLDEGEPHLKLKDFFPCPKPAYGTLRRRSLVPIPDYIRYASLLNQINTLTARIYLLLDRVRMKGLIPAGGDIGDAVEQLLKSDDDELLIPVPGAAFAAGGANGFVAWMPIAEVAAAIQGLITARTQLFDDYYQLSGVSDIMRGDTEAQETLGAQQLKSQYGSVRVRQKIDELQRIAADTARIVAEIASEKFSQETILDMAQMDIPTKADIKKQVGEIEDAAEQELESLANQAKQAAQQAQQGGEQVDPQQAQQMLAQAQQQLLAKYGPQIKQAASQVSIEDVMKLLRDEKARGFAFEIATDSTIMTDELQEKASRNEFFQTFLASSQSVMQLAGMGEAGAALAGGLIKFLLAPYRVGRELNKLVDDFVDKAPEMAAQMGGQEGESDELAAANMKLAEAEMAKASAQTTKVEADGKLKMFELQQKQADSAAKADADQKRLTLELDNTRGKLAETEARIEKIRAEIEAMGFKANIDAANVENANRKTDIDEFKVVSDAESRRNDQAMRAASDARNAQMGERQQTFTEQNSERQQTLAERQAQLEKSNV
jgi:uncharacterized protein YbaR (Trm112 family)